MLADIKKLTDDSHTDSLLFLMFCFIDDGEVGADLATNGIKKIPYFYALEGGGFGSVLVFFILRP